MRSAVFPLYWVEEKSRPESIDASWLEEGWGELEAAAAFDHRIEVLPGCENVAEFGLDWERRISRIPFFLPLSQTTGIRECEWRTISWRFRNMLLERAPDALLHIPLARPRLLRWLHESHADFGIVGYEFNRLLSEPRKLLLFCYQSLCAAAPRGRVSERSMWWLAVFGVAASGVMPLGTCRFCFRLKLSGQQVCGVHSRSKFMPGSSAEKARRRRIAVEAAALLQWPERRPVVKAGELSFYSSGTIARILWGDRPRFPKQLDMEIRACLELAPLVIEKLDIQWRSLTADLLVAHLRERLDELELNTEGWPEKIRLAQGWFDAVNRVSSVSRRSP